MAELHEALKTLGPIDWADVNHNDLPTFLSSTFAAGELISNSVPSPPNGEPFEIAKPHHTTPNTATTAKEMHTSLARPYPSHQAHEALQKSWGKPYKFKAEQNPLGVVLYKMAGNDRHGAWFARRSVHEGLGFAKFKKAMQREFPHSMTVQGGPGAGAVRGLTADQRLERQEVEGVGQMDVYQLSAQFPGPVAARDFMTLLLTTDNGLGEKSAAELPSGSGKHVPRHFMIVSKPIVHSGGPERTGFVRGQYESVELIREIPLHPSNVTGSDADPELNPVEWVMVTRSDPGGGLPRFLVERGTPEPMLADVSKFLNWACRVDDIPDPEAVLGDKAPDATVQNGVPSTPAREALATTPGAPVSIGDDPTQAPLQDEQSLEKSVDKSALIPVPQQQAQGSVMSSMAAAVGAGLDAYAPTAVSQGVHSYLPSTTPQQEQNDSSSDSSSDSSDANSFMSAEETRRHSQAIAFDTPQQVESGVNGRARNVSEAISVASAGSSTSFLATQMASDGSGEKRKLSSHEKELTKLARDKEKLDRKLAKKRADEENKLKKSQEKEQSGVGKVKERHDRDVRKAEERHKKEIEKLERKAEKEKKKLEEQRLKKDGAARLDLVTRERDLLRSQLDEQTKRVEELESGSFAMLETIRNLGGSQAVQEVVLRARKRGGSVGKSLATIE